MGHIATCILFPHWVADCDWFGDRKRPKGMYSDGRNLKVDAGPYMFEGKVYGITPDDCNSHGGVWSTQDGKCHVQVNEALCARYHGTWSPVNNGICDVTFEQFQRGIADGSTHKLAARDHYVEGTQHLSFLMLAICVFTIATLVCFTIIASVMVFNYKYAKRHGNYGKHGRVPPGHTLLLVPQPPRTASSMSVDSEDCENCIANK